MEKWSLARTRNSFRIFGLATIILGVLTSDHSRATIALEGYPGVLSENSSYLK